MGLLSCVAQLPMAGGRGRPHACERTDGLKFLTDESNGLREVDVLAHDGEHLVDVGGRRDSRLPAFRGAQESSGRGSRQE